jgi:hypothetical protein
MCGILLGSTSAKHVACTRTFYLPHPDAQASVIASSGSWLWLLLTLTLMDRARSFTYIDQVPANGTGAAAISLRITQGKHVCDRCTLRATHRPALLSHIQGGAHAPSWPATLACCPQYLQDRLDPAVPILSVPTQNPGLMLSYALRAADPFWPPYWATYARSE